jgi:hypothetical protein
MSKVANSPFILSVIGPSVVMLNVANSPFMLSVIMLSVMMLNVIMLNVVAPWKIHRTLIHIQLLGQGNTKFAMIKVVLSILLYYRWRH